MRFTGPARSESSFLFKLRSLETTVPVVVPYGHNAINGGTMMPRKRNGTRLMAVLGGFAVGIIENLAGAYLVGTERIGAALLL